MKIKTRVFLSLIVAFTVSASMATDKPAGKIGTTGITLSVKLMEGSDLLVSGSVVTLDGQAAPLRVGTERSYIAGATKEGGKGGKVVLSPGTVFDGFFITLTPTLTGDGKIDVEFAASKSKVNAIERIQSGDLEIQLPDVSSVELKQKVALDNGKEITLPFGTLVEPQKTASTGRPFLPTQYTLKIVATKS